MQALASSRSAPWHRRLAAQIHWRRHDLLKFIDELGSWEGDAVRLQVGPQPIFLLKHPDYVQQLLVAEQAGTIKARTAARDRFFHFLGDGLLNSKGESHRRQRRLVMPAFHRGRLAAYGDAMVAAANRATADWQDGETRDVAAEMTTLTLAAIGETLFSSDVGHSAQGVAAAFASLKVGLDRVASPGAKLFRRREDRAAKVAQAQDSLNRMVYGLIRERRAGTRDTGDLLSMLLLAEDSERPGERLADEEIRDQVMTLIFAGHETVAHSLAWTLWLLAQHPEIEAALHQELAAVLGGRAPGFAHLSQLQLTEQIVRESMRIYPPVWALGRMATADLEIAGRPVPQGSLLIASQWRLHRDARWFSDPLAFRPQRWTPEFRGALPRFAYFPFGGGPRSCIGEHFAWTELVLILAVLAQKWRFGVTPASRRLTATAGITLRPDRPVSLRLSRR